VPDIFLFCSYGAIRGWGDGFLLILGSSGTTEASNAGIRFFEKVYFEELNKSGCLISTGQRN